MRPAKASAIYETIGRAISARRQKCTPKMSQQSLATAASVSRASIANIEQGRHRIQLHVLYEIAVALELEPHDLLPHLQGERFAQELPQDISEKLKTPKEASAISRLIAGGKGDPHA